MDRLGFRRRAATGMAVSIALMAWSTVEIALAYDRPILVAINVGTFAIAFSCLVVNAMVFRKFWK